MSDFEDDEPDYYDSGPFRRERKILHWNYGDGPICNIALNLPIDRLTDDEKKVTCKRCIATIGNQAIDTPGQR